ncbi:MAG: hypothetical protein WA060_00995 [Minisyncoccia bacterium]
MNTIINNRIKALVGLVLGITTLLGLLAFATPAAAMTCNSATLTGTVITGTPPTHARFAYGTSYNTVANGGGTTTQVQYFYNEGTFPIQQYVSGLSENTTYYFRLEVTNNYGTKNLNINNFTTPSCGGGQPPITSLTCSLDGGATPAPHYINKGVKFEAFGGNGSYSWNTNGGTSDFESGSDNMRNWIHWSTAGTKSVSVSSNGKTVNCGSVTIIDNTPAQTCQDPSATNYGGALPCKYQAQTCQDPSATNYGGALPCKYPAQTCQDPSATNYGGALPCKYPQNNPTVNLTANPTNIIRGNSATLSWNSQYATSCSTSWGGGNATSGYSVVYPEYTTTYTITCQGASGTNPANDSVTVVVNGIPDQNPTVTLTADDENIEEGEGTTLRWYSNNATSCTASAGVNGWSGNKSLSGSFYTGALTYSTTYTITCRNNSGNTAFDSVTVDVNNDNNGEGPEVTTREATDIDTEDAVLNGRVDGNGNTTRAWFEYGTSASNLNRTTPSNSYGSGSTSYDARINNLDEDTTYYFRAMAENSEGTARGSILSFSTDDNNDDNDDDNDERPDVTTRDATNVSSYNATLNGRVDGNGNTTRAWFEYGTSTSLGYSTARTSYGSGSTNYDKMISGLMPNTTYYFRAMAENSEGTARGSILSFYTSSGYVPPYVPPTNNQPTVVIYADSTNLSYNGATTIRWSTVNATSCIASGGSVGWAGIKSIGPGSFYTGSLTGTRTYTINCSNNYGSSTDSVTVSVRGRVVTNPVIPSSYVIINSSIDRNQPIVPTIDNTRPHPGDEINYTVTYQNIGNASITGLTLRLDLPYEVDYMFSNPSNPTRSGNTLIFNLGTLRANAQGTVTVRVRVRENIPAGTYLNFPAVLSYVDPSGNVQSVNANVSAQVWSEPIKEEVVQLGANVFGAGFFPTNVFGWLLLIILILLLVYLAKYIFGQPNQAFVTKKITTTTVEH